VISPLSLHDALPICSCKPVFGAIIIRECSLKKIGQVFAMGCKLFAPSKRMIGLSAPAGILPFGFGRQPFPRPFGIGLGILKGNLYYRIIVLTYYVAFRTVGMAPIGTDLPCPPLGDIV